MLRGEIERCQCYFEIQEVSGEENNESPVECRFSSTSGQTVRTLVYILLAATVVGYFYPFLFCQGTFFSCLKIPKTKLVTKVNGYFDVDFLLHAHNYK